MRTFSSHAPMIVVVSTFHAAIASAQPNLPPPPPPPLEERPPVEPSPPPPRRGAAPDSTLRSPPPQPPSPPPSSAAPRHATPPPAPVHVVHARARVELPPEEPRRRVIAISWSPVALAWGRLGLEGEFEVARHHAIVGAVNALVFEADRGGSGTMMSAGFGFASGASSSLGLEIGYHYWFDARRALSGVFLGPSLLLGMTDQATAGDGAGWQGYWGGALDVGWQEVFPVGLTVAAGGGLAVAHMADAAAPYPRLVARAGWAF